MEERYYGQAVWSVTEKNHLLAALVRIFRVQSSCDEVIYHAIGVLFLKDAIGVSICTFFKRRVKVRTRGIERADMIATQLFSAYPSLLLLHRLTVRTVLQTKRTIV